MLILHFTRYREIFVVEMSILHSRYRGIDIGELYLTILPLCSVNSVSCGCNVNNISSENSVNIVNCVKIVNCINIVNCVNSVEAVYSAVLLPSLIVFFDKANLALTK